MPTLTALLISKICKKIPILPYECAFFAVPAVVSSTPDSLSVLQSLPVNADTATVLTFLLENSFSN